MAKRINKNMVVALTALGFVIMTVAGVLMILQLRDVDPLTFVALAEEYAGDGDWEEARLYYQKAYAVSEDEKYLVDVGQMYYNSGDERRAQQLWQTALTADPQLVPALEKLLEYAYEVAKQFSSISSWRRVREMANSLLEQRDQDPFGLLCRGRALIFLREEASGNLDEGFEALRRAVEIAPESVEYSLALALAEARQDRTDISEELFERLMASNTTPGTDAYRVRGLYARILARRASQALAEMNAEEAQSLGQQARQYFDDAIALAGDDPEDQAAARVFLARDLLSRDLGPALNDPERKSEADQIVEKVKRLLSDAIEINPDGFGHYMLLVDLYRALDRRPDAIQACEQRLERDIDRKGFKGVTRKRGLFQLLIAAANDCAAEAAELTDQPDQRDALLDKAERFVLDAKAEIPSIPQAIHTEGKILLIRGKDLEALSRFEEADKAFGAANWENKVYMANLYLLHGQLGAAREAIEAAVRHPGANERAWMAYARVLLDVNSPYEASQAAQQVLTRRPGYRDALLILMEAYDKLDRPDLVQATLEQLGEHDPKGELLRSRALMAEERFEEALAALKPKLESDPADVPVAAQAAYLHDKLGQPDQARAVLNKALEAAPDSLRLKKLALGMEKDLPPEERNKRLLAILKGIEDEYQRSWELARYYVNASEWDLAEAELGKAERLLNERATPEAVKTFTRLGEGAWREIVDQRFVIACLQEQWQKAEQIANQASADNLDGVDGLTFHGRLHLYQKRPDLAVVAFRQALDRQPNNSRSLTVLGQASLDLNRLDQAQAAFEQAVAVNPDNGLAHKGLAMLAKAHKDVDAALHHFKECQRLIPGDSWVKSESEVMEILQDPEAAIERFVLKRQEQPEDVATILQLGQLYTQTGRMPEAEECYEAALKLAPENLAVVQRLAAFCRRQGNNDRAEAALKNLVSVTSEPSQQAVGRLLLATHYAQTGETERADATYLAAADTYEGTQICLSVGRHFLSTGRPEMAVDWLQKAAMLAKEAGDARARDIQGMRVEALLTMKEYDRAMQGVEQLLSDFGEADNVALMFRADIEAARGQIDEAIQSLSRFLESQANHPLALFRRARYWALRGKWGLAISDLELLKARDPDALEFEPRKWLAQAYEHTGRFDLASAELESLVEERPADSNIAGALIRLYVEHESYDQANRAVQRMIASQADLAFWFFQRGQIAASQARNQEEGSPGRQRYANTALADMRRAAQMSDYVPGPVGALMDAYREFEAYDAGIEFYEKTLTPSQRDPRATVSYAGLLAKKGLTAKAVEQYRLAAQAGRSLGASLVQLTAGEVLDVFGQQRAVELFRSLPEDESLVRTNQILLATMLPAVQQYSEAATLFEQSLQTAQDDAEKGALSLVFGTMADKARDFERAKRNYENVIKLEPLNWVAFNNLAYMLCDGMGQCAEARPYAERAVSLRPNAPTVADTLATVLAGLGEYREAVGILVQALQIDPKFVAGHVHLANVYRCLGEFDEARAQIDEAKKLIDLDAEQYRTEADRVEETQRIQQLLDRIVSKDSAP